MHDLKQTIKDGGKIIDPDEATKYLVSGIGLCIHLYEGYEQHYITDETNTPTGKCQVCNKNFIFDRETLKFEEE